MADPDLFQCLIHFDREESVIAISGREGLIPTPPPVAQPNPDLPERHIHECSGNCGELGFNANDPQCDGTVTTSCASSETALSRSFAAQHAGNSFLSYTEGGP